MRIGRAFTLAEVLITLGVVGVVAAITLPTVIKNYQKHQTVTQLKYAYNLVNNALENFYSENGMQREWDWVSEDNLENYIQDRIGKYIKVVKYYGKSHFNSPLCPEAGTFKKNNLAYRWLDNKTGISSPPFGVNTVSLLTVNNICIGLNNYNNRAGIFIDINNSTNKPNISGKDLFMFRIDANGKIIPGFSTYDDCKKNSQGYNCSAKIIYNNWEIDKDYPW